MFVLIEQVDHEGGYFKGVFSTLEDAIQSSGMRAEEFSSEHPMYHWYQPHGCTALWTARREGYDVTFNIWAVAV